MGYIYLRKNLTNGKCYVGQAKDVKTRNRTWNCLNARYGGYAINNARKKYGTDGFSFEILKECPNEDMNYWEIYYIKMYNSKKPYGYNSTDGGDSIFEMTDEIRKKISEARKGKHYPKVSAARRGKKLSEERKRKISATETNHPQKSKAVQALDPKTLEVVMEFPSTQEAQRQYGFNNSHISACCNGKRKTHGGFIWRYAEK